jgi:hypothetical protein
MAEPKPVIPYDSPEAASIQTVTGWVSRDGFFYGKEERSARYSGCTHRPCDECGELTEKSWTKCRSCIAKAELERFARLERASWDGEQMLYSEAHDRYFSNPDEVREYAEEEDEDGGKLDITAMRIVLCKPQRLHRVDTSYWEDALPEDVDLPGDVEAALELLNEAISEAGPVSWLPGNKAWNGEG